MKVTFTLVWLGFATFLSAAPKFAVVRVTDIYRELPSTAALQKDIQGQRDRIIEDKRAERLRAVAAQLQSMATQLGAKKDELDSESGKKLIREYEIKRQEAITLQNEFEEYKTEENKRIDREMVGAMRAQLDRISEASRKIARERNVNGLFDTSGQTNTGVPFVLYSADAPDLTEDVVALLDEKPLEEKPLDAPVDGDEDTPADGAPADNQ